MNLGREVLTWVLLATAVAASSAAAQEFEVVRVPAKLEVRPFTVRGPDALEGRSIRIQVNTSCRYGPGVWHEVVVVERPKTKARPYKSAIITAVVERPAHDVYHPTSPPYLVVCPGIRTWITKRIKLKRPAKDLLFFDGSSSPPRRVGPPLSRR